MAIGCQTIKYQLLMESKSQPYQPLLSVSELTHKIKTLLEKEFPFIWIYGEISNLATPPSGHLYFSLKDRQAQVGAVMFRGQYRQLRFVPQNGMEITGLARLSVYPPRGTYQLIFEHLEPRGAGALQLAFEQLKQRLADEGLFEDRHKKPIPHLPAKVLLLTSPSGAVAHDFVRIAHRRFANLQITIIPTAVQGPNAVAGIIKGIEIANRITDSDLLVIARGGGSLEDLAAFNTERVARAIHSSRVPVVSAIGHETDYTIADFAADLRAPTPSAAAAMCIPEKESLLWHSRQMHARLVSNFSKMINNKRQLLVTLTKHLSDPKRQIAIDRIRIDDLVSRMSLSVRLITNTKRQALNHSSNRLAISSPANSIYKLKLKLKELNNNNLNCIENIISIYHQRLEACNIALGGLNPHNVLKRGYSITRKLPHGDIVSEAAGIDLDQSLEIILARGVLHAKVTAKNPKE